MNNELSFIPILYLLGSAQGMFLALALFSNKTGNRVANRYLSALTLVFALALIDYFLDFTGLRETWIQFRTLLWPKEFLYGALIYFYVRELTRPKEYSLKGRQWLHFAPVFLHAGIAWSLLLLSPSRQYAILAEQSGNGLPDDALSWLLGDFELWTVIFQLTVYLLLSFTRLNQHSQRIRETFSYTEKISLKWLRNLLIGIFTVYLIWLLEELFSERLNLALTFDIMLALSMVILIYTMGYLGLQQPEIFAKHSIPEQPTHTDSDAPKQAEKYKNSPLSADLSQALLEELQPLMRQDKLYLDNQLSLPQLAARLNVPVNYLSQVINEQLKQSFFDFINGYRIDEAKSRLTHPQRENENILSVAIDSGFNSKSAFYTVFKKHTGMTPGQFRKSLTSAV